MNVVDSSAWLEYFADGPNASYFAEPIEDVEALVVPTSSLFEVFKRVLQQRDESTALEAAAVMQQGTIVNLEATIALNAARLSAELGLPLADSVILATARLFTPSNILIPRELQNCRSNLFQLFDNVPWLSGLVALHPRARLRNCCIDCFKSDSRLMLM